MDVRKKFGLAVRRLRTSRGLSQEELAHRANIHRNYISDIERGVRNVSLENLEKIANALEVTLAQLFEEVDRGS